MRFPFVADVANPPFHCDFIMLLACAAELGTGKSVTKELGPNGYGIPSRVLESRIQYHACFLYCMHGLCSTINVKLGLRFDKYLAGLAGSYLTKVPGSA